MHNLLTFTWDMGRGIDLGFFTLRYYSLLFALGFVLGYFLMKRIFRKEGVAQEKLDTLLTYVVIATVVGARLGHVFFYQWDYYSQHPGEILKVWEGGLASHGAAIAIIIAIIIFSRKVLHKNSLWMLDRLVITIALAGAMIRMGNWFNSEIYGDVANSSMETVFTNPPRERILDSFEQVSEVDFEMTDTKMVTDTVVYPIYDMELRFSSTNPVNREQAESLIRGGGFSMRMLLNNVDKENRNIIIPKSSQVEWEEGNDQVAHINVIGLPRHPTQIYEAIGYFIIFLILFRIYQNANLAQRQGFIFGMFLILIFGFRFFIEYLKENQVSSEQGQALNIGQYLSIPLVLAGIWFVVRAKPVAK